MRILNLSSDYSKQGIYKNLAEKIAEQSGVYQDIYVPVRSEQEIGKNNLDLENANVMYSHILTKKDRLLYSTKIKKLEKDVNKRLDIHACDLIHAHFMFSDGGVAYRIWKKHKIPYIVAIRNTDINFFLKYAVHLRAFGLQILQNASKIILLSPAYKSLLFKFFGKEARVALEDKIAVIPNAIDNFWFKHLGTPKEASSGKIRLLYVGDFTKNKNVPFLIKAKQKYFPQATLDIVGSNGNDDKVIEELASGDSNVVLHGRVYDKEKLRHYYKDADILCIPSRHETFGVAYIESLSQGTPIIYTQGQGVDGYFEKPVGAAVPFGDSVSFETAVNKILSNYNEYSTNALNCIDRFNWSTISNQYIKIYEDYGSKN